MIDRVSRPQAMGQSSGRRLTHRCLTKGPRTDHESLAILLGTTLIFWKQSGQTDQLASVHFSPDLHYQKNPSTLGRYQSHGQDV